MTKAQIIDAVDRSLRGHDFQGASLRILADEVHQSEFAWHVPICPSFEPPIMTRYYEELASIEADLLMGRVASLPPQPRHR